MRRSFVQTPSFNRSWKEMELGDEELFALQDMLLENPDVGDTISETGGAKKVRIPLEGRGKSGGARVIYVDVVIREQIYLLLAYPKNVQADLTKAQKRAVRKLIIQIKGGVKSGTKVF